MIRLTHKETIKDKTKYDYETDNFSTHRRHDIMFTGTGKKQNGYRKRQSGEQKRVIELRDTTIDGKTVTDTLSIMTYEGSSSDSKSDKGWKHHNGSGWNWDFDLGGKTSETIISVTAIVFIFGLPLLIVFTVFFFNYKNRKAKYRLAEQALSSGQQLPEDFFKNAEKTEDIRTKGIKNIFIGIGLFIFLWAITGNFGVGCVGLLIMFTGFGQLVIYYTQDSNKKNNRER